MQKNLKKLALTMLVATMILSSCGTNKGVGGLANTAVGDKVSDTEKSITVQGNDYPLTVTDFLKKEVVLEKKADRVAVLSGTPLNIWYDLGGKSICSSDISGNIRLTEEYADEMRKLPVIGPVYSIDMEAVMEHNPNLIISQVGTQSSQAAKLTEMGFDVIQTHIRNFEDVKSTYEAFGKILGNTEKAEAKIKELEDGKNAIVEKLPKDNIKVAILYVTSKSLAVKLDNSIAGDVANILNLKNIASDLPPDTIGSETAPLDIEYIVEQDPDYIFVTTMISSNEEAKKVVKEQFDTNIAWQTVRAVKENKIIYLPQEYFLYNAGPYYVDAIKYVAQSIYPEIYGEVK